MILCHLSRQRSLTSLAYGRRVFQRLFHGSRPAWTRSDDSILSTVREMIKERVRVGLYFIVGCTVSLIVGKFVIGIYDRIVPSWDETLDAICHVIPPKTVSSNSSSPPLSTVYGPIHQDPPVRESLIYPDEFRVLVIEPGSGGEEIRCRLINVAKSWRTRYDALSYTWGDEAIRETIIVDGLRTSVTKNLHSALVNLRNPNQSRTLWVDALCVNQDDPDERDEQVKKMGSIYSNARQVVIWLSEQTQDVQNALSMMEKMCSGRHLWGRHLAPYEIYGSWGLLFHDLRQPYGMGLWNRHLSPADISSDWAPVFNLLRRPWFQRTWIVQEAVLGRKVVLACGTETIPWESVSYCCKSKEFQAVLPDDSPELDQALKAVALITHGRHEYHTKYVYLPKKRKQNFDRWKTYTPDFKLVSTLYTTRGFQCKDQRDKVFGVLSLVTNVGPEDKALRPNYRASVEDIYETVAQWDIEKNRSLELLSYCSRRELAHPSLPSWAPDFSDIDESYPISHLEKIKLPLKPEQGFIRSHIQTFIQKFTPRSEPNMGFESGHGPSFVREDGKTVLVLSGKVVDTIAKVGAVAESPRMVIYAISKENIKVEPRLDMGAVLKRRKWLEDCARIASSADPASQNQTQNAVIWKSDAFWKSRFLDMSVGHYHDFSRAMGHRGKIHSYAKFLFDVVNSDAQWHREWKDHQEDDKYFRKLVHQRRFCVAQTGRMGWAPGAAKEGDLVCQISGAQVPIRLSRLV